MNVTTLNIGIGANSSHPINSNAKIQTYHDYSVPNINPRSESNFHDYNAYTKNTLIYANRKYIEDFEEPNTILDDKMLLEVENLLYNSNHSVDGNASDKKETKNKINPLQNSGYSLPQLPVYCYQRSFKNFLTEKETNFKIDDKIVDNENRDSLDSDGIKSNEAEKSHESKNVRIFNDFKLNPFHFQSIETFGRFIGHSLNLNQDLVKEIMSNPRIQYWIDKNKNQGFVYQTYSKIGETKRRVPPVRCELCKFHGHLSHTCSIKELAFKLNNVVIKNGAVRCHICGQLGHPAEAGLCPYIACSFCCQNGHWNYMCPNKDKISRTLCFKCQRYGHSTERCPDQWRQFDRISTFEQTPMKDHKNNKKPVYCYQCAQKGHYGHNCPEFYRKYFIRDFHQLDTYPVYFFASSSPFVKYAINFNENDEKIVRNLVENSLDDQFVVESIDEDLIEELEKSQANSKKVRIPCLSVFNESHANIPLKEYIRKWSNWVIDFHWIFTLKYFIELLPTNKLHFFIKNYPSLDNFILHWMWWSYSLNKDLERFTKDPFRAIGSMPWLMFDSKHIIKSLEQNLYVVNQRSENKENNINSSKNKEKRLKKSPIELENLYRLKLSKNIHELVQNIETPVKFESIFQFNEITIKSMYSVLFEVDDSKKYDKNKIDQFIGDQAKKFGVSRLRRHSRSNSFSCVRNANMPVRVLMEFKKSKDQESEQNHQKNSFKNLCHDLHYSVGVKKFSDHKRNLLRESRSTSMINLDNLFVNNSIIRDNLNYSNSINETHDTLVSLANEKKESKRNEEVTVDQKLESDDLTSEILNRSQAILTSYSDFEIKSSMKAAVNEEATCNTDTDLKKFIENKLKVKIESSSETVQDNDVKCDQKPFNKIHSQSPVSSVCGQMKQETNVFDKFFKSFNCIEDNKIQKQNEQNLNRIFELLNKKSSRDVNRSLLKPVTPAKTSKAVLTQKASPILVKKFNKNEDIHQSHISTESTNMIKFLLKIDNSNSDEAGEKGKVENKIEVEPDKLDAALSIYNDCPTTLNKILLNTKNPIIIDTSHQPGILVLSSSSSSSSAVTSSSISPLSNSPKKSSPNVKKIVKNNASSRSSSLSRSSSKSNKKSDMRMADHDETISKTEKKTKIDEDLLLKKKEINTNQNQTNSSSRQKSNENSKDVIKQKTQKLQGITTKKSTNFNKSLSSSNLNKPKLKDTHKSNENSNQQLLYNQPSNGNNPGNDLGCQYANFKDNAAACSYSNESQKVQSQNNMAASNNSSLSNSCFDIRNSSRSWTPTYTSQEFHKELQKQHQQRMQNFEMGTSNVYFQYPYAYSQHILSQNSAQGIKGSQNPIYHKGSQQISHNNIGQMNYSSIPNNKIGKFKSQSGLSSKKLANNQTGLQKPDQMGYQSRNHQKENSNNQGESKESTYRRNNENNENSVEGKDEKQKRSLAGKVLQNSNKPSYDYFKENINKNWLISKMPVHLPNINHTTANLNHNQDQLSNNSQQGSNVFKKISYNTSENNSLSSSPQSNASYMSMMSSNLKMAKFNNQYNENNGIKPLGANSAIENGNQALKQNYNATNSQRTNQKNYNNNPSNIENILNTRKTDYKQQQSMYSPSYAGYSTNENSVAKMPTVPPMPNNLGQAQIYYGSQNMMPTNMNRFGVLNYNNTYYNNYRMNSDVNKNHVTSYGLLSNHSSVNNQRLNGVSIKKKAYKKMA